MKYAYFNIDDLLVAHFASTSAHTHTPVVLFIVEVKAVAPAWHFTMMLSNLFALLPFGFKCYMLLTTAFVPLPMDIIISIPIADGRAICNPRERKMNPVHTCTRRKTQFAEKAAEKFFALEFAQLTLLNWYDNMLCFCSQFCVFSSHIYVCFGHTFIDVSIVVMHDAFASQKSSSDNVTQNDNSSIAKIVKLKFIRHVY